MKRHVRLRAHPHVGSPHGLYPFVAVLVLFVLTAVPAFAGYSWCSRDPVLTFSRGAETEHVLDVQVAIPTGVVFLGDPEVTLNVRVPSNVTGIDLLAPVTTPLFNVSTSFSPTLAATDSEAYTVFLHASYPAPVDSALVITGAPLDGFALGTLQVSCEGRTARSIRAKVSFAPLQVYCQQDDGWVLVFG